MHLLACTVNVRKTQHRLTQSKSQDQHQCLKFLITDLIKILDFFHLRVGSKNFFFLISHRSFKPILQSRVTYCVWMHIVFWIIVPVLIIITVWKRSLCSALYPIYNYDIQYKRNRIVNTRKTNIHKKVHMLDFPNKYLYIPVSHLGFSISSRRFDSF